jgi:hypothetical protein
MNPTFLRTALGLGAMLGALVIPANSAARDDSAAIQPWPANPWYWQYQGHPVFLAGGSDDDNLFQWPKEKLIAQLDLLQACGGNYLRNTMSDRHDKGFELYPFRRLPNGKYDLGQWNDAYWQRFATFLDETEKRGIIVQIEVWDRFDYSRQHWIPHPYNPKNNVNYTAKESGLAANYPNHPGMNRQPFFFTVPTLRNNQVVLKYQIRFVDKLLSYSLRHHNVLYCMDNETSAAPEWGAWWARHIKERARAAGRRVCVTEMWDDWNLRGEQHRHTFDHPELYDFVDVSQNNQKKGQVHWDNFQWVRRYLAAHPRPMNTVKTYGADTGRFGNTQDGLERLWRHVLGGAAAVRFHRPPSGLGLSPLAQASLRSLRLLERSVKLWDLQAGNRRLGDRAQNEAYLASRPGRAFVVLFPRGGAVTLDLRDQPGAWQLRWLDVRRARIAPPGPITGNQRLPLKTPTPRGFWLAILTRP